MKSIILSALVVLAVYGPICGNSAKLPDSFQRCKKTDPNLDKCLQSAIEKAIRILKPGLPSLQMLPVDPLAVTKISIQDGAGRPVNIKLDLNDVKAIGLSQANINAVRSDLKKRVLEVDALLPVSTLEANYVMDGKFLVLPVKGKGKCKLDFTGLNATLKLTANSKTKNNKVYWDVHKFGIDIKSMQNFKVNFEDLFNGDKALGDNTNKVLNENWQAFWGELKPSFEETFGQVFLQLSNVIFGKVPEKDIFLD